MTRVICALSLSVVLLQVAACASSGPRTSIARDDRGFEFPWAADDRCNFVVREGNWLGVASTYRIDDSLGRSAWNDIGWWLVYDLYDSDYKSAVRNGRWPLPIDYNGIRPRNYASDAFLGVELHPNGTQTGDSIRYYQWLSITILFSAFEAADSEPTGDYVATLSYDDHPGVILDQRHVGTTTLTGTFGAGESVRWRVGAGGESEPTGDADADRHISLAGFLFEPAPEYAGDVLNVRIVDPATRRVLASEQFDARGLSEVAAQVRDAAGAFYANFESTPYCYR